MSSKRMRIDWPRTLAGRLTLWYAALFVGTSLAAFGVFYLSMGAMLGAQFDEDLREDIEEYRQLLSERGLNRLKPEILREVPAHEARVAFVRLLNNERRVLASSDLSAWPDLTIATATLPAAGEPVLSTLSVPGQAHRVRVVLGRIGPDALLHLGESMEDKDEFMALLLEIFSVAFLLVIALAALGGWFMARRALHGVEAVSLAATQIAQGALDRRVTVRSQGAEIDRLVDSFNTMADRNHALLFGMREISDNIAHDLRSPLARIRAIAEMALSGARTREECAGALADTIEECDRLQQMVNTMLDVAEVEAGAADLAKQDVDYLALVRDVCELFEPIAEDKAIALSVKLDGACRIQGNGQHLQRMLANLLDNALKYTPAQGAVTISVQTQRGNVITTIRDTGIGISPQDQSRVFRRFFRCDDSRSHDGCGLGLNLARAVARWHGGDIVLRSEPGVGSEFTVLLPA